MTTETQSHHQARRSHAMTVPKPETRLAYSSTAPRRVALHDFAAAAFLHARDHSILHVGLDHNQKVVWHFGGDANDDLDVFYRAKDHLMALRDRANAAALKNDAR